MIQSWNTHGQEKSPPRVYIRQWPAVFDIKVKHNSLQFVILNSPNVATPAAAKKKKKKKKSTFPPPPPNFFSHFFLADAKFGGAAYTRMQFIHQYLLYRPYAYDVTEGRPAASGVKQNTATCVIAKHAARGANPASHTAGLARPGPRTERLSANAHCQHNTCALRDTRLASLLWRCDPLWRQCIRSIQTADWKMWKCPPPPKKKIYIYIYIVWNPKQ